MKYIKSQKLFEAGSWSRGVDLEYVRENPDADDECSNWIRQMEFDIESIQELLSDPSKFELLNILGFDMYRGPYAIVNILGKSYQVWYIDQGVLWIENFVVNNSPSSLNPGLQGDIYELAEYINLEIEATKYD